MPVLCRVCGTQPGHSGVGPHCLFGRHASGDWEGCEWLSAGCWSVGQAQPDKLCAVIWGYLRDLYWKNFLSTSPICVLEIFLFERESFGFSRVFLSQIIFTLSLDQLMPFLRLVYNFWCLPSFPKIKSSAGLSRATPFPFTLTVCSIT